MTHVITVANMKGGTGKTTTAAHLAHGIRSWSAESVLAVDADPPGSLMRWSETADWPLVPVVQLATTDLHKRLPGIIGNRFPWVVIDTPPLDDRGGIVYSALRAADTVVIPVSPTTADLDRFMPIVEAIEEVAPMRADPPQVRVLIVRAHTNTRSIQQTRDALAAAGMDVLESVIPRRERYALAFNEPVQVLPDDPYALATRELMASVQGVAA